MNREELLKNAKPILFNTEMVQAILDNRKSVTRRVIKAPILLKHDKPDKITLKKDTCKFNWNNTQVIGGFELKLPYKIGDYLWVRETWADIILGHAYKAGINYEYLSVEELELLADIKWKPSIHMPKEAARIFLKVTDVRVERVQDILCEDMKKEGCIPENVKGGQWQQWQQDYFKPLWNSTIKKGDITKYGFEINPWVWVIEFERVVENERN